MKTAVKLKGFRDQWFMGRWGHWVCHSSRVSRVWWGVCWAFHEADHYRHGWHFSYGRFRSGVTHVRFHNFKESGWCIEVELRDRHCGMGWSTNL